MNTIKKQLKHAFTIVELVIVIAVIAALAAVLIPTFVNVVNSANESADTQMLANINKSLAAENILHEIETPEQALDVAEETGYSIEKLTPTSAGNYIVYDETTVSFALIDSDGNTVYSVDGESVDTEVSTTWYFASSQSVITSNNNYKCSYIITGTWNGDVVYNGTGGIDTSRATIYGGVVAGTNSSANGNSGNVAVSAKKKASNTTNTEYVLVFNISGEYGGFAFYYYPSNVKFVIYTEVDYNFSSTVDESLYTVVGSGEKSADIEYSTSGVTIAKQVISEVCSNSNASSTENFVLELGTEKYPYLIESVEEWISELADEGTSKDGKAFGSYYWKVTADLDFNEINSSDLRTLSDDTIVASYEVSYFKGYIDFGGNTITMETKVSNYNALFRYVYGNSTFSNLNLSLANNAKGLAIRAYLENGDITFSNIITSGLFKMTTNNVTPFLDRVYGYGNDYKLTFENCINNATITASGNASATVFLGKVVESDGYGYANLVFDTCINNGTLIFANGYASMLIGNGCTFTFETLDKIIVKNCVNYGQIYGANTSSNSNLLCGGTTGSTTTMTNIKDWVDENAANLYNDGGVCEDKTFGKITKGDSEFDLSSLSTAGTATSYSVSFTFWVEIYDKEGGTKINHGSYTITATVTSLKDLSLPSYSWMSESDVTSEYTSGEITIGDKTLKTATKDGTTYYVFEENNVLGVIGWVSSTDGYVTISGVSLTIYEYISSNVGNIYTYSY